jgi:hypothetical protein
MTSHALTQWEFAAMPRAELERRKRNAEARQARAVNSEAYLADAFAIQEIDAALSALETERASC